MYKKLLQMCHKLSDVHRIALKKPVRHGQNLEHGAKNRKYYSGSTPDPKGGQKGPKSLKWSRLGGQRVAKLSQGGPKGSPKESKNESKTVSGHKHRTLKKRKVKSC